MPSDKIPAPKVDEASPRGWPLPHRRNKLRTDVERLRAAIGGADQDVTTIEGRAEALEGRADALEGRADALEGRADALEGRADALEGEKADETSVRQRFEELAHDALQDIQTGAWRHLTPGQLAAFPELGPGDKIPTEAGMIAAVDLGAAKGSPTARLPEVSGLWAYVAGLGLFRLDRASAAVTDGETSILPASGAGRWLLASPAAEALLGTTGPQVAIKKATPTFNGIAAWGSTPVVSVAVVPCLAKDVLRVEPPPAPGDSYYTWTVKDGAASSGGGITGASEVTAKFFNRTAEYITPTGEWTVAYLDPMGGSLAGWRFLRWLQRAQPSGAEIDAALGAAENAAGLADVLEDAKMFPRAFGDDGPQAAIMASPAAMRAVAASAKGRTYLIADAKNKTDGTARWGRLMAADGLRGTMDVAVFWTEAADTWATEVAASDAVMTMLVGSRTAMTGVGAKATTLLNTICSTDAHVARICADGDRMATLFLSAYGMYTISRNTGRWFTATNAPFYLRLCDHAEARDAFFSTKEMYAYYRNNFKNIRGYLSGLGWTQAAVAEDNAVGAAGGSAGWTVPGLAFVSLGYSSAAKNAAKVGLRYGSTQVIEETVRNYAPWKNLAATTSSGSEVQLMPAGGWTVTVEPVGNADTGAYYAELWVPPGS